MPSDDDRPPRIARRVERDDDEFSDPPPEGPAPYLFRKPHPNEGRLLDYAVPGSAGVLILAGVIGAGSEPGAPLPRLLVSGCVAVWLWWLSHFVRRSVFR